MRPRGRQSSTIAGCRRRAAVAAAAVALVISFAPPAFAEHRLTVDDDGAECPNAEYDTIQAAITAAHVADTVFVCEGTSHETVTIATPAKAGVRVIGQDPERVVLDGDNALQHGFVLNDVDGVLVEGFTVREYVENISLLEADDNTIRHNVSTAASQDGIITRKSHRNLIEHNTSSESTAPSSRGFNVAEGSSNNVVRHNLAFDNGFGVQLTSAGTGNVVAHNVSRNNLFFGILNSSTPGSTIAHNKSYDNGDDGLVVFAPHGVSAPQSVIVEHNHVSGNGRVGIAIVHGSENVVSENVMKANGQHGILVHESFDNIIEGNQSDKNVVDGIAIKDHPGNPLSSGNLVVRNHMRLNGEHDCHDESVGTATAGTGNVWVNNKGETENRPGLCRHGQDQGPSRPRTVGR